MSAHVPILAALRGLPGIGKSALARAVGRELEWPVLDKDDFKEIVYGRTAVPDELSYDLLFRPAQRQLRQGLSVIADSPLLNAGLYALAARTASEVNARMVVIGYVLSDAQDHRRRIDARAADGSRLAWAIRDWAAVVEYRERVLACWTSVARPPRGGLDDPTVAADWRGAARRSRVAVTTKRAPSNAPRHPMPAPLELCHWHAISGDRAGSGFGRGGARGGQLATRKARQRYELTSHGTCR